MSDTKQDSVQNTDNNETENQSVDTTTQTAVGPSERELQFMQLMRNMQNKQEQQIQLLKQQLDEVRSSSQPPENSATYDEFMADPEKVVARAVEKHVSKLVAPIVEETKHFKVERSFKSALGQVITQAPQLAPFLKDQDFSEEIQRIVMGGEEEVTPTRLYIVATSLLGQRAMEGKLPSPTTTPKTEDRIQPASINSQPPKAPKKNDTEDSTAGLSEEELEAAKILGMSPAKYKALAAADGSIESLRAAHKLEKK